ncbi:MAG: SDR family NAD(P)-dependent oxidoreductase [Janthinobacterium lividum]
MIKRGFDLDGRTIVVTGGSSGIGRASAMIMAGLGARVIIVARDGRALAGVVDAIRADGGVADWHAGDVGNRSTTEAAVGKAEALYGPVDGFFANAGMSGAFVALADYPDDIFDTVMAVNVKSLFWAMKRVLPGMIARRSGAIVATGSLAGERGLPMTLAYNASKHAVIGLVRSAAAEVAPHNVRINVINPGLIETRMLGDIAGEMGEGDIAAGMADLGRMVPMGRVGRDEDCGRLAAFLLSDAAAYVTAQAWAVDGGILGTIPTGG